MNTDPQIFPLGDGALTVSFGSEISPVLNDQVLRLAGHFDKNRFAGLIETVPAYASLTVFYDVLAVRKEFPEFVTAFDAVQHIIANAPQDQPSAETIGRKTIEIPVSFEKEDSPDLEFVAGINQLSKDEVIRIFTERTYRVYMIGFLPGFAYMGEIDDRIAAPRLAAPRELVPKGSVGIAGRQTGIYSLESPGGWQIIGRTDVELFTPADEHPTFLQAGDLVRFFVRKPL